MAEQYNPKCAGVKRLMKEAKELYEPTEMYYAQPLEENLFEWHFTIRGTIGTDFEGGIYHGRILFPPEYPMKPPNIFILTPNGRFELHKKICLSISGYHPETWLPSWSIRTALLALIGFLPSEGAGALGSLNYPPQERRKLAKMSGAWKCPVCEVAMKDVLLPLSEGCGSDKTSEEAKVLATKLKFQDESDVQKSLDSEIQSSETIESSSATAITAEQSTTNEVINNVELEPTTNNETSSRNTHRQLSATRASRLSTSSLSQFQSSESSIDYSLFFYIPLCFIAFGVFIILLSRRFLIHTDSSMENREL